jgi:hypothetical protein
MSQGHLRLERLEVVRHVRLGFLAHLLAGPLEGAVEFLGDMHGGGVIVRFPQLDLCDGREKPSGQVEEREGEKIKIGPALGIKDKTGQKLLLQPAGISCNTFHDSYPSFDCLDVSVAMLDRVRGVRIGPEP